jgi:hypothetical protein
MPTSVIGGTVRAVEPGRLTLSGDLHIVVPPGVRVPDLPLGCGVTVVVREQDGQIIAESIKRTEGLFDQRRSGAR